MDLGRIQNIEGVGSDIPFSYIIPGVEEAPVTVEQFFKPGFCPSDSRKLVLKSKQRVSNAKSLIDVSAVVVDDQESTAPGHDEYIFVISTVAAKSWTEKISNYFYLQF